MENSQKRTEAELYEAVIASFPHHLCFSETPFFGKSVDLIFTQKGVETIYAVEVKLTDWRSALKQASINQLFACFSYVAMPQKVAERLSRDEAGIFYDHGVGIISSHAFSEVVLEAKRSEYVFEKHRKKIATLLRTRKAQSPTSLEVVQDALAARKRSMELLQTGSRKREGTLQKASANV